MSTLVSVYEKETFEEVQMQLSLGAGAKKYTDWQQYQNGANDFAVLTLFIAMREFLTKEKNIDPSTFTSTSDIYETYFDVEAYDKWEQEDRNLYILHQLKQSAFRHTIGNTLREFAVRHHAAGLTTAEVITLVLESPHGEGLTPLRDYANYFPAMKQDIRDYLSTQLNYLKRGQSRFPQKYIDLWEQARQEHLQEIQHIPLTHISEQVQAMQQHYDKLLDAFNALPPGPEYTRERERLTNAMNKTMGALYQMTRDPAYPKPHALQPGTAE